MTNKKYVKVLFRCQKFLQAVMNQSIIIGVLRNYLFINYEKL